MPLIHRSPQTSNNLTHTNSLLAGSSWRKRTKGKWIKKLLASLRTLNDMPRSRLMRQWLRSHMSFFYHSKQKFTMVNRFFNVTDFSHFTMVNATLVCCVSNGGRMKAKFTIVKPSQKAWFIARLSKLCLFRLHLVTNFEKHFVT